MGVELTPGDHGSQPLVDGDSTRIAIFPCRPATMEVDDEIGSLHQTAGMRRREVHGVDDPSQLPRPISLRATALEGPESASIVGRGVDFVRYGENELPLSLRELIEPLKRCPRTIECGWYGFA